MGTCQWLSMGRGHVRGCRTRWSPRRPEARVREQKCPWDEMVFACAAAGGKLEVVEWLFANGCPWNELTCLGLRRMEISRFCSGYALVAVPGIRTPAPTLQEVVIWSFFGGHMRTGAPGTRSRVCMPHGGSSFVLQWARTHGCPWDESIFPWHGVLDTFTLCNGYRKTDVLGHSVGSNIM